MAFVTDDGKRILPDRTIIDTTKSSPSYTPVVSTNQPSQKISSLPSGLVAYQQGGTSGLIEQAKQEAMNKPRIIDYNTLYTNYDTQLNTTHENIVYVENLPPGSIVNDEGMTREQALDILHEQETNLTSDRDTITNYEQQGYTVKYDPKTDNYIFSKQTTTTVEPKEIDYKTWWMQREKELGTAASIAKAISAGTLNIFNFDYWAAIVTGRGGEYIYKQEYKDWKRIQEGKGLDVWVNRQIPAYENVIIPFMYAAGLGAAIGVIGKIGSGAIKLTGIGAKSVTTAAKTFSKVAPVVLGGSYAISTGANIGKTLAYEQHGMVEQGASISAILAAGMQLSSAIGGYHWASNLVKPFGKEAIIIQDQSTGMEYAYGRRYIDLFGKQISGKPIYYGARPIKTTNILDIIPISQKSVIPLTPVKSISQVFGAEKITFNIPTKQFIRENISISTKMKPLEPISFKNITPTPKPISELAVGQYKTPEFDLFKKINAKPVQTKIESFEPKGRFIVEPKNIIETEIIPQYKGLKPYKPTKTISKPKPSINIKDWTWTEKDELKIENINKKAMTSMEQWKNRTFTLKDIIKPEPIQQKLFEKEYPKFKPLTTEFKPPTRQVKTLEDIYKDISKNSQKQFLTRKPVTKQTKLDLLYSKLPIEAIIVSIKPVSTGKTPFKFPKTEIKPFIEKPSGKTSTILQEPVVKEKIIYPFEPESENPFREIKGIKIYEEQPISSYWDNISPFSGFNKTSFIIGFNIRKPTSKKPNLSDVLRQKDEIKKISVFEKSIQDQTLDINQNLIQSSAQEQGTLLLLGTAQIQESEQKKSQIRIQGSIQESFKISGFESFLIEKTLQPREPIIPLVDNSDEIIKKVQTGQTVYHVLFRKQQFKNGKRINNKEYHRVTRKPLNYMDALAYAADKIGNTAKASFKLEKTIGKPGKLSKTVKPFNDVMVQYEHKENDRFVELSSFRIDSPGEIREISMKGWKSHKKKRRRIK